MPVTAPFCKECATSREAGDDARETSQAWTCTGHRLPEAYRANLAYREHRLLQLTGTMCWVHVVDCDLQQMAGPAALSFRGCPPILYMHNERTKVIAA